VIPFAAQHRLKALTRHVVRLISSPAGTGAVPIHAGNRVLQEPWEINHVSIETALSTMDGFTLV
jgi:hypothetical protein